MHPAKVYSFTVIFVAAVVLAGCTNSGPAPIPSPKPAVLPAMPNSGVSNSTSSAMAHQVSIQSEKDFILLMIPHHAEAIEASKIFVSHTTDANLKELAQGMINIQTTEITQLKQWLKDWYGETYVTTESYEPMMRDLSKLRGIELNATYVADMAAHHLTAIEMATQVQALKPRVEINTMAGNVIVIQTEEMLTLQDWLAKHPQ